MAFYLCLYYVQWCSESKPQSGEDSEDSERKSLVDKQPWSYVEKEMKHEILGGVTRRNRCTERDRQADKGRYRGDTKRDTERKKEAYR